MFDEKLSLSPLQSYKVNAVSILPDKSDSCWIPDFTLLLLLTKGNPFSCVLDTSSISWTDMSASLSREGNCCRHTKLWFSNRTMNVNKLFQWAADEHHLPMPHCDCLRYCTQSSSSCSRSRGTSTQRLLLTGHGRAWRLTCYGGARPNAPYARSPPASDAHSSLPKSASWPTLSATTSTATCRSRACDGWPCAWSADRSCRTRPSATTSGRSCRSCAAARRTTCSKRWSSSARGCGWSRSLPTTASCSRRPTGWPISSAAASSLSRCVSCASPPITKSCCGACCPCLRDTSILPACGLVGGLCPGRCFRNVYSSSSSSSGRMSQLSRFQGSNPSSSRLRQALPWSWLAQCQPWRGLCFTRPKRRLTCFRALRCCRRTSSCASCTCVLGACKYRGPRSWSFAAWRS